MILGISNLENKVFLIMIGFWKSGEWKLIILIWISLIDNSDWKLDNETRSLVSLFKFVNKQGLHIY